MAWVKARRDFTFQGTSYSAGDVVEVSAIVGLQMKALRAVEFLRGPGQTPSIEPQPQPQRRSYRKKAPVPSVPVDPPAEIPEPQPEPVVEPMTTETAEPLVSLGTYARKDLRAEDE